MCTARSTSSARSSTCSCPPDETLTPPTGFKQAIDSTRVRPVEVTTDRAPAYPAVLEALLAAAWHRTDQYANNGVECDHGRLKA
jgi:DDE domain